MLRKLWFEVPGDPVPFARAASFGSRRFTPAKQRDYMLEVRRVAWDAMAYDRSLFVGPLLVEIWAYHVYPAGWSQKKRAATFFKTSRPDVDNLAKVILDAIGGNDSLSATDKLGAIVFEDDATVCQLTVGKRWAARASVTVAVQQLV